MLSIPRSDSLSSLSAFLGLRSSQNALYEKPFSSFALDEKYAGPVNKIVIAINTALEQGHKITGKQIFEPDSTTADADARLKFITLKIFPHKDGLTIDQPSLEAKLIDSLGKQLSSADLALLNIQLRKGQGGAYYLDLDPEALLQVDLSNVVQEDKYTESIYQLTDLCNSILQGQHAMICERCYEFHEGGVSSGEVNLIALKLPPCATKEEATSLGEIFKKRLQELLTENYDQLFSSKHHPEEHDGSYFLALKPDALLNIDFSQKMQGETDETFESRSLRTEVFCSRSPNKSISLNEDLSVLKEYVLTLDDEEEDGDDVLERREYAFALKEYVLGLTEKDLLVLKKEVSALQNIFSRFKKFIAEKGVNTDQQNLAFSAYITHNPTDHKILREIFNSSDPKVNKKKFDTYIAYYKAQIQNLKRLASEESPQTSASEENSYSPALRNHQYRKGWYASCIEIIACCYFYINFEEQRYADPTDQFMKACDLILNHRYSIEYGELLNPEESVNTIRIKIVPRTKTSEAEINLKLIQELKNRLGEENFEFLVTQRQGSTNRTYLIDLDVLALQKLEYILFKLRETIEEETPEQFAERSAGFVERNVQALECNKEFNKVCEIMEHDGVNLISKADFVNLCRVYNYFKEAVTSDENFQQILKMNPTLGFNPKDEMDMNIRYQCFGIYINTHIHHKNILRRIFNYADPQKNKIKYDTVFEYLLNKEFVEHERINIASALKEFLMCSYQAVRDEEKMYLQAGNNLCNAMNFISAYTNPITCQPRFSNYDKDDGTVTGSVESILVKRRRQHPYAINDITQFRNDIQTLLVEDSIFNDLVMSPDPTKRNIKKYITADNLSAYVLLKPSKLLQLDTRQLMPLPSSDLKMYEILLDQEQRATDEITILDTSIQSFKINLEKYQIEQKEIEATLSRAQKKLEGDKITIQAKKSQTLTMSSGSREKTEDELKTKQRIEQREATIADAKHKLERIKRAQKGAESELAKAEKFRAKYLATQTICSNLRIMYSIYAQFSQSFDSNTQFKKGLISRLKIQGLNSDDQRYACFILYLNDSPQHQQTIQKIFKNASTEVEQVFFGDYMNFCKKSETSIVGNDFKKNWYRSLTRVLECCFRQTWGTVPDLPSSYLRH